MRGYTGDALALLTDRQRAYGYRHTERFLSAVARTDGAQRLTDALAGWTSKLWPPRPRLATDPAPAYYVDGHRKAVYSDKLLPRGLVSRCGKVLGCRALMLLHDEQGHPLLATTHRGDTHLTAGLPKIVGRYERVTCQQSLRRIVIDREGMAAGFLARLAREGRDVITVLRSNQYAGMGSFTDVGEFVPLWSDRHGEVTREVTAARCSLPLPNRPPERLDMRAALVRDLRRLVPCSEPRDQQRSPYTDYADSPSWSDGGSITKPKAVMPTEPALVPIVTTATGIDPLELAGTYRKRWPIQENVIRDWLLPLGLDTNHGYAKLSVPNSEAEKKSAALEKRLANVKRWGEKARLASAKASKTSSQRWQRAKARSREAYSELNGRLFAIEGEGLSSREYRARGKELVDAVEAEMEGHWRGYYRSHDTCNREYAKWERYCQEQQELLREMEDLKAGERQMYELDDSKDQVMTVLKLVLANLAMWARDNYFPPEYCRATWQRLISFFQLHGHAVPGEDTVDVELRGFNDHRRNRDLAALSTVVAEAELRLPDGRQLLLTPADTLRPITRPQERCIA